VEGTDPAREVQTCSRAVILFSNRHIDFIIGMNRDHPKHLWLRFMKDQRVDLQETFSFSTKAHHSNKVQTWGTMADSPNYMLSRARRSSGNGWTLPRSQHHFKLGIGASHVNRWNALHPLPADDTLALEEDDPLPEALDDTVAQEEEDPDLMKLRTDRAPRKSSGNLSCARKKTILTTLQHGLRVFSDLEFDCEALCVKVKPLVAKKSTKHSYETLQTLTVKNKEAVFPMLKVLLTQFRSVLLLMDTYFKVHVNLALELLGSEDTFDSLLATISRGEPKDYYLHVFVCEIPDPKSKHGKFDLMLRALNKEVRYASNDEIQNFNWTNQEVGMLHDLKRRAQVITKAITILTAAYQLSPIQHHKAHQDIDKSRYPWAAAVSKFKTELVTAEKVMLLCRQNKHKREEEHKEGKAGFTLTKKGREVFKALIEGVEHEVDEEQEEEEEDTDAGGDTGGETQDIDDGDMDAPPSLLVRTPETECVQQEDKDAEEEEEEEDQTYEETEEEDAYEYSDETLTDKQQDNEDPHNTEGVLREYQQGLVQEIHNKENQDKPPARKPKRKAANNALLNNENVKNPEIRKRYKVRDNSQFYYCIYCKHIRQVEEKMKEYMPLGTKMDDNLGHYINQMCTDLNVVARRLNSFKKMQRHMKGHFKGTELSIQEMNTKLPPLFQSCFKGKPKRKRLGLADIGHLN
jgi:hypothetical protein